MTEILIAAVIILIVASLFYWFFSTAPFIQEPFRQWGCWATVGIAALFLIIQVVIPLVRSLGHSLG